MGKRSKGSSRASRGTGWRDPDDASFRSSPFAALAKAAEAPELASAAAPVGPPASAGGEESGPTLPRRAVLRLEKKGRGGKRVTLLSHLSLPEGQLEAWARELSRALGCGAAVEGDTVVLQGDQRKRAKALLQARGLDRISVS